MTLKVMCYFFLIARKRVCVDSPWWCITCAHFFVLSCEGRQFVVHLTFQT
jgi:hypothetical protein